MDIRGDSEGSPGNEAELDLGVAFRRELKELVRLGIGSCPAERLREAAPHLWATASQLFPSFSQLSDVPLRSLLREAARISEPAERGLAANHLLGLWNDSYGKSFEYRRDSAAGVWHVASSTFRTEPKYEKAVLDEVAARAAQIAALPSVMARRDSRRQPVRREEPERALLELVCNGGTISVWGEPGVGKSWLAREVLARKDLPRFAVLHGGGTDRLTAETSVLNAQLGLPAGDSWRVNLVHLVAAIESGGLNINVLLDEFDGEADYLPEVIECLDSIADRCAVVVTCRKRVVACQSDLRVEDFTREEALACCRTSGLKDRPEVLLDLCDAVGFRPLAIQQASLFLTSSGRTRTGDLATYIRGGVDHALNTVAKAVQARRNLSRLYRSILDDIDLHPGAGIALDCLSLQITSATPDLDLAFGMASVLLDAEVPEVEFDCALYALYNAGLLTSLPSRSGFHELAFSPLTAEIIRDVRSSEIEALVPRLASVIVPSDARGLQNSVANRRVKYLQDEIECVRTHPEYASFIDWGLAVCLSGRTWLRIPANDSPSVVFVESDRIVRLAGGIWEPMSAAECRDLLAFVEWYKPVFDAWYDRVNPDAI